MKKDLFKRLLAMLLMLAMVLSLAACSFGSDDKDGDEDEEEEEARYDEDDEDEDDDWDEDEEYHSSGDTLVQATELSDSDLRYVMIYNPQVYDENAYRQNSSLKLGDLGRQVDVYGNRGEELEPTEEPIIGISQDQWMQYFSEDAKLEGDRGEIMGTDYELGDTQYFYYTSGTDLNYRDEEKFTCVYEGEYCYIWTMDNSVRESTIEDLGEEFDDEIYEDVSELFGTPRFVGRTGKVNILLFEMTGSLCGYFAPVDLFVESEHRSMGLDGMDCNTGHAIINVNSLLLEDSRNWELACSTAAHELQHLINFSAFFQTSEGAMMETWLNEAFSGYVEEILYEGIKENSGDLEGFADSNLIRNGQSLYNFGTGSRDYGVYGSVYCFARYLEEIAGEDIFSDIMDYWRTSYSDTLSTAEALAESVSSSVYNEIDSLIDYDPLDISFSSSDAEWMSKLCLSFYLEILANEQDIYDFDNIDPEDLLYDSMDGVDIEGGGRVIVALSDDTFEIPEDSDEGLIYIGLDEDFRPITEFVYQ